MLRSLCIAALPVVFAAGLPAAAEEAEVYALGDRLELFVDDRQVESMDGVRLVLHPPERREAALVTDRPWEGPDSAYFTVFQDDDRFRMYYRGLGPSGIERACYAESADGIRWTRPDLGLFDVDGSKDNNVVLAGGKQNVTHNFTAFSDTRPGVPDDERYKALAGTPLWAFASADGTQWRLLAEEPVLTQGAFDSQNLAFWDPNYQTYVSYYRAFIDGARAVVRAESADFLHWGDPVPIDLGDAPREHFYTNATSPYFRAPHYYFAFPKRFQPDRKRLADEPDAGISEAVFLSSRDGLRFDRTFMEAFIRPGRDERNWADRSTMPAWGLVQTGPDEMSIYFSQHYSFPSHHLCRGVLRLDGIASAQAGYREGELITRPLTFAGAKLVLNYSTGAFGSVRVEVQDAEGAPLSGYALADSRELYGDQIAEAYSWTSGADLSALAGRPVRLRFLLKDADLYSYRFAP
jgi:hypothetical protein